ncbi:MAG: helix-turn-helix transcriptional regulator [Paludibacterium sp.]|uniref:winged helix-turn-helix transcriptional regulator n=1 Tax=Paludibacterium sp. TaxID=1917523 RepID=UPI0025D3E4C8|nr:helix-turn-helix domain-containing protein [Paludibacterium sp.]MBV8048221.1 helix-turn-helix transcriptional regulator [Paludibacterium sp.]MBV8645897.1 helix-turn-helix transcriptional regulator [Paludibacterium sp.]
MTDFLCDLASYNVYSQACPARLVLDRLADKWSLLLMDRLSQGPVRFNQLRRDVEGISQKVLSQSLKKLERDGLIARRVFATVPVTVEYTLTELGATLSDTVASLAHWAERNIDAVLASQRQYDAHNA